MPINMVKSRLECVILAAGYSRRLGRDKAQISIGNETLIEWLFNRISARGVSITLVANERNATEIVKALPSSEIVINPKPDEGRTGSLKLGITRINKLRGPGYRLLVVPVDRPGFSDSTLEKLIASFETSCPQNKGIGGHPLLLDEKDVQRVRNSPSNMPLNKIVEPSRLEVADKHLHLNLDTPNDIEKLFEKLSFSTDI